MELQPAPTLRHSHAVLLAHLVWTTHRRAPVLVPTADAWLAHVFGEQARALGCQVVASGGAMDHVHVVVRYGATVGVAEVARRLKGGSSHAWNVARRPSRDRLTWQAGYWAESVSPSMLPALLRYVANQRAHHRVAVNAEPWEAALTDHATAPPTRGHAEPIE